MALLWPCCVAPFPAFGLPRAARLLFCHDSAASNFAVENGRMRLEVPQGGDDTDRE